MVSRFDKTWDFARTLWLTFSAKARAHAAGGVGKMTDLAVIGKGGRIIQIGDQELQPFYPIFDKVIDEERRAADAAVGELKDLIMSLTSPSKDASSTQTATEESATASREPNGVPEAKGDKED
jgi:hypothetical protein